MLTPFEENTTVKRRGSSNTRGAEVRWRCCGHPAWYTGLSIIAVFGIVSSAALAQPITIEFYDDRGAFEARLSQAVSVVDFDDITRHPIRPSRTESAASSAADRKGFAVPPLGSTRDQTSLRRAALTRKPPRFAGGSSRT